MTDDDIIEKSNLSRQFLFRNHNVGQSKSLSAAQAAKRMNPSFQARALQVRPNVDRRRVNPELVLAKIHPLEDAFPSTRAAGTPESNTCR